MNIKVHTIITDILGKTGLRMVLAIIEGERNIDELMKLKDRRIKAKEEDIRKSLVGIWKDEYLFLLKQAYDEYMFYQSQINACEEKIQTQLLKQVAIVMDGDISDIQFEKKSPRRTNSVVI